MASAANCDDQQKDEQKQKNKKVPNKAACRATPLDEYFPEIFLDLETTGLSPKSHITQIAAVSQRGTFNVYVKPKKPIEPKAAEVTGITYDFEEEEMFHNKKLVESVKLDECLKQLLDFLGDGRYVLVAHNGLRFDSKVLLNALLSASFVEEFEPRIAGFLDTLRLIKAKEPGVSGGYNQPNLVKQFLGEQYEAHNALADVKALKKLLENFNYDTDVKLPHTFSFNYIREGVESIP